MEDLEKCPDMGEENNTLENPKIKREVFFLDDDHNIVDPGKSTQLVIGEYDENGRLIKETFGYTNVQLKNQEKHHDE